MIIPGTIQLIDEHTQSFVLLSKLSNKTYRVPYTSSNYELVKKNFDQNETTLVDVKIKDSTIESITIM